VEVSAVSSILAVAVGEIAAGHSSRRFILLFVSAMEGYGSVSEKYDF
jgi:hypothetical protein